MHGSRCIETECLLLEAIIHFLIQTMAVRPIMPEQQPVTPAHHGDKLHERTVGCRSGLQQRRGVNKLASAMLESTLCLFPSCLAMDCVVSSISLCASPTGSTDNLWYLPIISARKCRQLGARTAPHMWHLHALQPTNCLWQQHCRLPLAILQ